MTLEHFTKSMSSCKAPDFSFDDSEIQSLFSNITGASGRTVGLELSVRTLSEKVYEAVKALLVDQMRAAF